MTDEQLAKLRASGSRNDSQDCQAILFLCDEIDRLKAENEKLGARVILLESHIANMMDGSELARAEEALKKITDDKRCNEMLDEVGPWNNAIDNTNFHWGYINGFKAAADVAEQYFASKHKPSTVTVPGDRAGRP